MALKQIIDPDAFAAGLVAATGDRLRGTRLMRLGNPETGAIFLPADEANYAGEVWVHEMGGSYPQLDSDGTLGDNSRSVTTALLPSGVIPYGQIVYDLAVRVKQLDGLLEVVGIGGVMGSEYLAGVRETTQRSVDFSQFDYGLLRPTIPPSMSVDVSHAIYDLANTLYDVKTLNTGDLSGYQSGLVSGEAVALQLTVDPTVSMLSVTASSTFTDTRDSSTGLRDYSAIFASLPNSVGGLEFNIGWAIVYHGQLTIEINDLYPGMEVYTKAGSAVDFDVIVTDEDGNIVVDDDGNVVVGES